MRFSNQASQNRFPRPGSGTRTARSLRKRLRRTKPLSMEWLESRRLLASWSGEIFDATPGVPLWTANEVQRVVGNVRVPAGKTLTIQPGTVIQFNNNTNLTVDGVLTAVGTDPAPIYFTSVNDNSPLGGNNTASAGSWGGITFNVGSDASQLEHIVARYGGLSRAGLIVAMADVRIASATVSHTPFLVAGIRVQSADPVLTDLTLHNNYSAMSMDLASSPTIVGASATNNTVNGMLLDGGSLTDDVTWKSSDLVYVINGTVTVPAGRTLHLENGQVVKAVNLFASFSPRLIVDGTLQASGEADRPVVFTAYRDDSAGGDTNNDGAGFPTSPGDWAGIQFNATSTANVMDHVEVRYGGNVIGGAIVLHGAPLSLTNSVVRHTAFAGPGLRVNSADPVLEDVTFRDNQWAAIGADLVSRPRIRRVSMSGNRISAMVLDRGTLPGDTLWDNADIVYAPDAGELTIPEGTTLTIAPGVIVKPVVNVFRTNLMRVAGTLDARGTVEKPIIFTSILDHTAGGVTNQEGVLGPGAGYGFLFTTTSANSRLDHVEIRYGAEINRVVSGRLGTVNVDGALTLSNSVVRNSAHVGVFVGTTGTAELANNLIVNNVSGIQAQAGAIFTAVNNTIDGSAVFGVILDSPNAVLTNNLVTNSGTAGIRQTGPTELVMTFNNVFNPGRPNYSGLSDLTGLHGNLSRDPLYFGRANLEFHLLPGSPVQDAGTSSGAPPTDFLGHSRFDDPKIVERGDGSGVDMGALEVQESATSNIDLVTLNVVGPEVGTPGMNATVQWTVKNQGIAAAVGSWSDAIYLSPKPYWTPSARFLKRVTRQGGLGVGGAYTVSTDVTLTGVLPGKQYFIVRGNDLEDVFEGQSWANNAVAAVKPVRFDLPTLLLNVPYAAQFSVAGESDFYQVDVAGGQTLEIALRSLASPGIRELYVRRDALPSRAEYDFGATELSPHQNLVVPMTQPGTYYVLAFAGQGTAAASDYTLTARTLAFGLDGVSPSIVGNGGPVTLAIQGSRLTDDTQVRLVAPDGTVISAIDTQPGDSTRLHATFDLTDRQVGEYDVRIERPGESATAEDALTVRAGTPGNLRVEFLVPGAVRAGRQGTVIVRYTNDGLSDLAAPLLTITSSNPTLRFVGRENARGDTIEFLAINPSGPAGVLPPGASGAVDVQFTASTNADEDSISFRLLKQSDAADQSPLHWAAAKDAMRPDGVSSEAWDAIFANFMEDAGDTVGEYQTLLNRAATYLSRMGRYVGDESHLLAMIFRQAGDFGAIGLRHELGAFGRGVPDPTAFVARTDAEGHVRIVAGVQARTFFRQPNGSYRGTDGDRGLLTLDEGVYRLRETDGMVVVFREDGRLDYRQDRNGNRVTAGYTDGRLTSFTESSGDVITLRYNAHGRIDRMTDPVGRVTDFAYDAAGEHLLSITNRDGTQRFTYVTGQGPQTEHAIASVEYPDGTRVFHAYDHRGRLIRSVSNGGAYELNYSHDGLGGVTVTNSLGDAFTTQFNELGQLGSTRDQLGQVTLYHYDDDGRFVRKTRPDGSLVNFTRDGRGNPISAINPLGHEVVSTFDAVYNTLQMVRDAGGAVHSFRMDSRGNPLSFTYPDGAKEQFRYDETGKVMAHVDPLGRETRFTYDENNLLTRQDFADGSWSQFTYDVHRNLTSASNANGATSYEYDLATDRLVKVTYPDGRFLTFAHDAVGRRTRIADQSGFAVNYAYDALGRLSQLTRDGGERISAYSYDALGRLSLQEMGAGVSIRYGYDAIGRMVTQATRDANDSLLESVSYTYDSLGRRSSMTTMEGMTKYRYDASGQLTSVELPGGRLVRYEYDAAGNRSAVIDEGVTTEYTSNPLNQITSAGTTQFTYDAAGNLIARGDVSGTTTYEYSPQGNLVAVHTPTGSVRYDYDALGNRIGRETNGQWTRYLVDPAGWGNVFSEYDAAGQLIANYTQGLGLTSRVDASGNPAYYVFDGTGNTTLLVTGAGGIVNQYEYLPYGEVLAESESTPNPFTFGGRLGVMREANDHYFMRSRYYDASVGRFTTRDRIGMSGGLNLYAYTANDPVNRADPGGTSWDKGAFISSILLQMQRNGGLVIGVNSAGTSIALHLLTRAELIAWARMEGVASHIIEAYAMEGAGAGMAAGGGAGAGGGATLAEALVSGGGGSTVALEGGGAALGSGGTVALETSGGAGLASRIGPMITGALPTLGTGLAVGGTLLVIWEFLLVTGVVDEVGEWWESPTTIQYGDAILAEAERLGLSVESYVRLARDGVVQRVSAIDPNDIAGPLGYGDPHYVIPDQTFPYIIHFENLPTATAPALVVAVTQQLDSNLDWSTFELGDFGFGPYIVSVPAGRRYYATRIDATDTVDEFVDVTAELDVGTGRVTWTFTSIDPATGLIPEGATDGFLPPENGSGVGQGFTTYRVHPRTDLATGDTIPAQARVIFDAGLPGESFLDTPVFVNTIDITPPSSSVTELPAYVSTLSFTVEWSGTDEVGSTNQSGVASYDVYVAENDGPFTLWRAATTATSAVYTGILDNTYRFYSTARDHLGNTEFPPSAFDTQVTIVEMAWHNLADPLDVNESGASEPVDALLVINELNSPVFRDASGRLPVTRPPAVRQFLDVSADGLVTPVDALLVINALNGVGNAEGESLPPGMDAQQAASLATDWILARQFGGLTGDYTGGTVAGMTGAGLASRDPFHESHDMRREQPNRVAGLEGSRSKTSQVGNLAVDRLDWISSDRGSAARSRGDDTRCDSASTVTQTSRTDAVWNEWSERHADVLDVLVRGDAGSKSGQ